MASSPRHPSASDVAGGALRRVGVVVHPTRAIEGPLRALREWIARQGVELVQVPASGAQREVAQPGRAEDCDLIVSIGGDGTMLAGTRAAWAVQRPVLGVACGSLGALTSVGADAVEPALDRFRSGDWVPRRLPALEITREQGEVLLALNDIVVIRAGQGQIRTSAEVDGSAYVRLAGDGCVVSTALGSSAYALAAGGPLVAPGADAFLLTPLSTHGGFSPPLVIGAGSRLGIEIDAKHSGTRVELDGQVTDLRISSMQIRLRSDVVTLVSFDGQESLLTGLRRRRIIIDSPRILAEQGGL